MCSDVGVSAAIILEGSGVDHKSLSLCVGVVCLSGVTSTVCIGSDVVHMPELSELLHVMLLLRCLNILLCGAG